MVGMIGGELRKTDIERELDSPLFLKVLVGFQKWNYVGQIARVTGKSHQAVKNYIDILTEKEEGEKDRGILERRNEKDRPGARKYYRINQDILIEWFLMVIAREVRIKAVEFSEKDEARNIDIDVRLALLDDLWTHISNSDKLRESLKDFWDSEIGIKEDHTLRELLFEDLRNWLRYRNRSNDEEVLFQLLEMSKDFSVITAREKDEALKQDANIYDRQKRA